MTKAGYLTAVEALEVLGLYNPASGRKPYKKHLTNLHRRGLLKRTVVGPKTIIYKKTDCEALFNKAQLEGIILTEKP